MLSNFCAEEVGNPHPRRSGDVEVPNLPSALLKLLLQAMKQLLELHPKINANGRLYKYYLSKLEMIGLTAEELQKEGPPKIVHPSPRHIHSPRQSQPHATGTQSDLQKKPTG